jgi:glycosyltransferase involved in cell wall biosynthesis
MAAGAEAIVGIAPSEDVCLLVEGTYPYLPGGVSAWVHDIINGHPELTFSVFNIGSHPGAYGAACYAMPAHVTRLYQTYCRDAELAPLPAQARARLEQDIRRLSRASRESRPSRVLGAIRRIHLGNGPVDQRVLDDLVSGDLSLGEFLHGRATFELIAEIAQTMGRRTSFLDLFWHFRSIYVPILRLLEATEPPAARCFHAVSTGYAGLCGAAFSARTGRPLIVTEHGIYSRERDMDLARASWIKDSAEVAEGSSVAGRPSPLRALWSRSFRVLSQLAYLQASRIVTLSDANRARQIADGAPADKISIVPNGVAVRADGDRSEPPAAPAPRLRVGFVGRVVPIKDVISFIRACHLALAQVDLDVRIIGPTAEEEDYARRCRALVESLGLSRSLTFVGPQPPDLIYRDLDVVVLTSFSEGQPLVILEAYAAGLPVVATDVGACREMIEGRTASDRLLGASGFVTRVGIPEDTAAALVRLARDPELRTRLGAAGRKRVVGFYRREQMLESYRALYRDMVTR